MILESVNHAVVFAAITHHKEADYWRSSLAVQPFQWVLEKPTVDRYICGRGLLGSLLAQQGSHRDVRAALHCSDTGRLLLIGSDWYVSISHAEPWTVAAISRQPFGVDIERKDRIVDWRSITDTQLPPSIVKRIYQAPADARRSLFLREWTRIEASAKLNKGLVLPLEETDISDNAFYFETQEVNGCIVTNVRH